MRVHAFVAIGVVLLAAPLAADARPVRAPGSGRAAPRPEGAPTYYSSLATFQAAAPGSATLEDFEEAADNVAAGNTVDCGFNRAYYFIQNHCWSFGDVPQGLEVATYTSEFAEGSAVAIHGAGVYGNSSVAVGTTVGTDLLSVEFLESSPSRGAPVVAAGLDLYVSGGPKNVDITLWGVDEKGFGVMVDQTQISVGTSGQFFGFVSAEPIIFVDFTAEDDALESLDNVRFLQDRADVRTQVGGLVSSGVLTLTVNVTNEGPLTNATGVTAVGSLSSRLSYVSNDCGATFGSTFSWPIGTLVSGETETCHVTANVIGQPGSYFAAFAAYGNESDVHPENNSGIFFDSIPGPGPSTAETGINLFRSFPDVTIPDENGTPFSFRAHADKLLMVQVCTAWCPPCNHWTEASPDLHAALASAIGAENFELVDLVVEGSNGGSPSTQSDAAAWKSDHLFPGPVLHSEGSAASPLQQLYNEIWTDYNEAGTFAFPHFFILAPNCENQIQARGTVGDIEPGPEQLGEEVVFHLFDDFNVVILDQVVGLATQIWNENRCAQPLVHRIDRCSVGSAPLDRRPNGNSIDAAENFTVPGGQSFDISSVHAVVEDAGALSFDVDVYPDAAGKPGAVPACSYNNVASTQIGGPWVRRIDLTPHCTLNAGNYWFGLEVRAPDTPRPWRGGVLPDGAQFAFRDTANQLATGCTDWDAAGNCLGSEAEVIELCYDLEAPAGLFLNGFETTTGLDAWSGHQP